MHHSEAKIKAFESFVKEFDRVTKVQYLVQRCNLFIFTQSFMALVLSHGDRLSMSISKEFNRFGTGFVQLADVIANSGEIDGRGFFDSPLHPSHPTSEDVNLSFSVKTAGLQIQKIACLFTLEPPDIISLPQRRLRLSPASISFHCTRKSRSTRAPSQLPKRPTPA